ncbi:polysaccharide deacetylase family protein [Trichlorobacter ammonificans]|uniref:Polysaccharide deacetylase n=1 Tax=Trichlorobacter ammonificans TaxID=2916410 RepID=A0ABN8HET7_9BACT|nr:polysaccharide deacetylase family protein [Trichlorobacter ammonificans]CAH2031393.1 Polysaccharide deacetylase [Trichlorobacter ammonificans]
MKSCSLKQTLLRAAGSFGLDSLFRYLNRGKLLVVMYHGVTAGDHRPPVWTQLPVERFRKQVAFLRSHYTPLTLTEVTAALAGNSSLPERALLITFDDGLRNNYSCAFPILQQMGVPAAVFLTVDLIGTQQLLWFDELLFLLREALDRGLTPPLADPQTLALLHSGQLWPAYLVAVERLKRAGRTERQRVMERLRREIPLDRGPLLEDFGLLSWDQVTAMHRSGQVEFGVHTATHRIVSELAEEEWEREITLPRRLLEERLGCPVTSFCFPNGRPGLDFVPEHGAALRRSGYLCAFSTENVLFGWPGGDAMAIGRVPAGNDGTSDPACFALNTSGALQFITGRRRRRQRPETIAGEAEP